MTASSQAGRDGGDRDRDATHGIDPDATHEAHPDATHGIDPDATHGIDPDAIHGIDPDAIHGIDDHALQQADARLSGGIALAGAGLVHLGVGFFVWFTGLIAPVPVAIGLMSVWIAGAVAIGWWHRRRPLRTLLIPLVMAGIWFAVIGLGDTWFDWSA